MCVEDADSLALVGQQACKADVHDISGIPLLQSAT